MDINKTIIKGTIAMAALTAAVFAGDKNYSGAELYTKDTYMYGKYEARMQMAAGSGTVSSMFLYYNDSYIGPPEPWVEVDIEILGKDPGQFQSNIITGYGPGNDTKITSEQLHQVSPATNQSFHTYGMEWTPDYVRWTLDGVEVRKTVKGQNDKNQVEDLKKREQGLRFNLWSSEEAAWVGPWDDKILPVFQFINWVKVYKYDENTKEFVLDWVDNFDSFDSHRWLKGNWTFDGNRVDISPKNIYAKDGMIILALTKKGEEEFKGEVPKDPEGDNMLNDNGNQQGDNENQQGDNGNQQGFEVPPRERIIPSKAISNITKESKGYVNVKGARVKNANNRYRVNFEY